MSDIERIGVSLKKELLTVFDKLIAQDGYTNRSEAIRDLIRDRISQKRLESPTAKAVAGLFIVYNHHSTQLSQKLLELQHNHLLQVVTSLHIHLDEHNCLEAIILKGKVKDIENLANKMTSLKGVKLTRMNIMTTAAAST